MVGTYYTSSSPDAPPFVTNGSVVHPKTIVGVIEAMKVFTEIPAYVSGTIVEILVEERPAGRVRPATLSGDSGVIRLRSQGSRSTAAEPGTILQVPTLESGTPDASAG